MNSNNRTDDTKGSLGGCKWTADEKAKLKMALKQYPYGPWKAIAQLIPTRTLNQITKFGRKYGLRIVRIDEPIHFDGHATTELDPADELDWLDFLKDILAMEAESCYKTYS
ncbi:Aste57867_12778 [Aphanomyces stellatus]|uniref:Aste57867_12778 protein n=1 Tax=Aphanomyces stellatus TaxID=120398 RepID=A0A485KWG3_9STRA|nr:hypothetical protein As57867_012730 [Aphanomyces stellatus]VFT89627.1 Aste57867_12778 [Aphanomyces stellatus]